MSISNCSIDERGKATGGEAGDNNGKEWRIRSWYSYPWNVVLRHPDAATRKLITEMAVAAANNDCIGYDQGQRLTFWNELKKVDYKPENIKTLCESDCSAGVAAIVKGAGYRLGNAQLQSLDASSYTGNLKSRLKAVGFEVLTDSKYLTSDKYLFAGDILLKESHHTAINITDGSKAEDTSFSGESNAVKEWQLAAIADGFSFPKYGADGEWGSECESVAKNAIVKKRASYIYKNLTKIVQRAVGVDIDGLCGTKTDAAIRAYQKANGLVVDGEVGLNTWKKILKI